MMRISIAILIISTGNIAVAISQGQIALGIAVTTHTVPQRHFKALDSIQTDKHHDRQHPIGEKGQVARFVQHFAGIKAFFEQGNKIVQDINKENTPDSQMREDNHISQHADKRIVERINNISQGSKAEHRHRQIKNQIEVDFRLRTPLSQQPLPYPPDTQYSRNAQQDKRVEFYQLPVNHLDTIEVQQDQIKQVDN